MVLRVRGKDTPPWEAVHDPALKEHSTAADVGQSNPLPQVRRHRLQDNRLELRVSQVTPDTQDQRGPKSVKGRVSEGGVSEE